MTPSTKKILDANLKFIPKASIEIMDKLRKEKEGKNEQLH